MCCVLRYVCQVSVLCSVVGVSSVLCYVVGVSSECICSVVGVSSECVVFCGRCVK